MNEAVAEFQELPRAEQRLSPEQVHAAIIKAGNLKVLEAPKVVFNPADYDLEQLQHYGVDKERAAELLNYLVYFLNIPIIQDGLGNDDVARHRFRDTMGAFYPNEAEAFLGENKLRINKLNLRIRIEHYADMLSDGLHGQKNPIHEALQKAVRDLDWMRAGKFKAFSEEGKIAHIREADQIARNILELFKREEQVLKEFSDFVSDYLNLPDRIRSRSEKLSEFMARLDRVVNRMRHSSREEIKTSPVVVLLYKKQLSLQQTHGHETPSLTWRKHMAEDTDLAAEEISKAFNKK